MLYTIIGIIVGLIMGLTGAGGAMISIPLFVILLGSSLKEATVLSLVAVLCGTAVNLFGKLPEIQKKTVFFLSLAGTGANFLTLPLKAWASDLVIAGLLTIIGIYSVMAVWLKNTPSPSLPDDKQGTAHAWLAGAGLGLLTTLTGLGGGLVLMPILIKVFRKNYEQALPTSLATIFLVSLASFILQWEVAISLITFEQMALIGAGAILAYLLLRVLLNQMEGAKVLHFRRAVFTAVTLYSVLSVILKAS